MILTAHHNNPLAHIAGIGQLDPQYIASLKAQGATDAAIQQLEASYCEIKLPGGGSTNLPPCPAGGPPGNPFINGLLPGMPNYAGAVQNALTLAQQNSAMAPGVDFGVQTLQQQLAQARQIAQARRPQAAASTPSSAAVTQVVTTTQQSPIVVTSSSGDNQQLGYNPAAGRTYYNATTGTYEATPGTSATAPQPGILPSSPVTQGSTLDTTTAPAASAALGLFGLSDTELLLIGGGLLALFLFTRSGGRR
jgi:hypothetical protein